MFRSEDLFISNVSLGIHCPGFCNVTLTFGKRAKAPDRLKRWDIGDDTICTDQSLVTLQRPLAHLLRFDQLALVSVESPEIVDRVERRRVLWTQCLLLALQCPLVQLLGLDQLALVSVEVSEIVDRGERRRKI
jgi:hypothetical protein